MKIATFWAAAVLVAGCCGQSNPVQVILTAEGQKGTAVPELTVSDLILDGDQAALELAILIDDGSDPSLGLQFDDLRRFIREQPSATNIGLYYIRNGSAVAAQAITPDRNAAVEKLRLPLGQPGIASSPFLAISDLVKKWPATKARREILLISSGVDLYRGTPAENPYLSAAIADCQRAHVLVNSIYFQSAGHAGHSFYLWNFGRDNLAYIGDETGGEAYWQGLATSVSFEPYLDDLKTRLQHQYLITLEATQQGKGRFERLHFRSEQHNIDLVTPARIWIPGSK